MSPYLDPLMWFGWTAGVCLCVLSVAGTAWLLVRMWKQDA